MERSWLSDDGMVKLVLTGKDGYDTRVDVPFFFFNGLLSKHTARTHAISSWGAAGQLIVRFA